MSHARPTLGTRLRHLLDLLDGAVEQAYGEAGLDYRPRYTPVMRVLLEFGEASIRTIAERARVTHSAASQTVAQMAERGLVALAPGSDGRERIVALTPAARAMVPALERQWAATNAAARRLDDELAHSLIEVVNQAIAALEHTPFSARIAAAAARVPGTPRRSRKAGNADQADKIGSGDTRAQARPRRRT